MYVRSTTHIQYMMNQRHFSRVLFRGFVLPAKRCFKIRTFGHSMVQT